MWRVWIMSQNRCSFEFSHDLLFFFRTWDTTTFMLLTSLALSFASLLANSFWRKEPLRSRKSFGDYLSLLSIFLKAPSINLLFCIAEPDWSSNGCVSILRFLIAGTKGEAAGSGRAFNPPNRNRKNQYISTLKAGDGSSAGAAVLARLPCQVR